MSHASVKIKVKGNEVEPHIQKLKLVSQVNRIPYAELCLKEDSDSFASADPIEFTIGEHSFIGLIAKKQKVLSQGRLSYKLCLKHPAIRMTRSRRSKVFPNQPEATTLKSIVEAYGLKFDGKALQQSQEQLVQHDCSDWDFLLCRAEANGLLVVIQKDMINIVDPVRVQSNTGAAIASDAVKKLTLTSLHQQALDELTVSMHNHDDAHNPGSDKAVSADAKGVIRHKLTPPPKGDERNRYFGVHGQKDEVTAFVKGCGLRNTLSQVQGSVELTGLVKHQLLDRISIEKVPEMETTTLVSKIQLQFVSGALTTCLDFGLSEAAFADKHAVHSPPAANLLPAIQGLQIARVVEVEEDKTLEDRIRVVVPQFDLQAKPIWARCLFTGAGENRGVFFTPEVGDEVLLGFLNNDPRHAVVLGALYSHKVPKPFAINSKENAFSGITTKNQMQLRFHDKQDNKGSSVQLSVSGPDTERPEDKSHVFRIENGDNSGFQFRDEADNELLMNKQLFHYKQKEDNKGNKLLLDKTGTTISRDDKASFTLNSNGITLKVQNNSVALTGDGLTIRVGSNSLTLSNSGVELKSSQAINIESSTNVAVKGPSGIDLN